MKINKLTIVMIYCIYAFLFCGCSGNFKDFTNEEVEIVGLGKESIFITQKDLSKYKCYTVSTNSLNDNIDGYGPLLTDVLDDYNVDLLKVDKIKFIAKDDYSTKLSSDFIKEEKVYLSISRKKTSLYEEEEPLRIIIPSKDKSTWVRSVNKIEIIMKE